MKTNKSLKAVPFLLMAIFMTSMSASAKTDAPLLSVNVAAKATSGVVNSIASTSATLKVDTNTDNSTNTIDTTLNVNTTASTDKSTTGILYPAQVVSEDDLNSYSLNVMSKDENISDIKVKNDTDGKSDIVVTYKHKGRFLGLFPVTIKSETTVSTKSDTEAEVDSDLSWWSFLVTSINYDEDTLEASIKNNSTIKSNTKLNASASAKAQMEESIIVEVKTNAITNTKLDTPTA